MWGGAPGADPDRWSAARAPRHRPAHATCPGGITVDPGSRGPHNPRLYRRVSAMSGHQAVLVHGGITGARRGSPWNSPRARGGRVQSPRDESTRQGRGRYSASRWVARANAAHTDRPKERNPRSGESRTAKRAEPSTNGSASRQLAPPLGLWPLSASRPRRSSLRHLGRNRWCASQPRRDRRGNCRARRGRDHRAPATRARPRRGLTPSPWSIRACPPVPRIRQVGTY